VEDLQLMANAPPIKRPTRTLPRLSAQPYLYMCVCNVCVCEIGHVQNGFGVATMFLTSYI